MRYSYSLLGLAALAAASDVHDLTKDSFEKFTEDNALALIEFFAPWCGHCKALAPEYEEAATTLKPKDIPLAKVDCTEESDLCQEFGIEGYPTLKVFRGQSNTQPYVGPRKAEAIVSYMTKQSLPAVSKLTSAEALEEFKGSDKVVIIGYFPDSDKTSLSTFTEAANTLRDSYVFGTTNDDALAKAEGVKPGHVVLYKTFDEGKNTYEEEDFTVDDLSAFIKTAATPLIGAVGPETYGEYMASGLPLAYIFSETAEEREVLSKELKDIAEKYKGQINFATIDAKQYGQHGSNLNLKVGEWPAFAIQDIAKSQKFPLEAQGNAKDLAADKVGPFIEDFVAGKLEPSIKSEPVPEKQDGPVTIVVAHNYKDIVLDESKDVLLEFYAPWCGHCKNLAPKYDELGEMFKGSDKVIIAKVDATLNDVPDEITGFPTIKLFKGGDKTNPVIYSGQRTVDDLAKFVAEEGTFNIDVLKDKKDAEDVDTDDLPHQAPAASQKAEDDEEEKDGGIVEKVKEAAEAVKEAVMDEEEPHDEL